MKAESMFTMTKVAGFDPDVIAYTAMISAYNAGGKIMY